MVPHSSKYLALTHRFCNEKSIPVEEFEFGLSSLA